MIKLRLLPASKIALLAILIATAGLSSASFAQKGKSDQKKPPPKKEEPKAEQKKDDRTPINCVIYLEYDPDKGNPQEKIAFNKDIKSSAIELANILAKKDATSFQPVHSSWTFDQALASFTEGGKKCCKKIHILGHGGEAGKGGIDLPYEQKPVPGKGRRSRARRRQEGGQKGA